MPTGRQMAAAAAVGQAVRAGSVPGAPGLAERVSLLPAMVVDSLAGRFPGLSRLRMTLMLLGVLYIVSPVDLVPESALLLLGLTDDVLVAGWVVAAGVDVAGDYALWRRATATVSAEPYPASERTWPTVSADPASLSSR